MNIYGEIVIIELNQSLIVMCSLCNMLSLYTLPCASLKKVYTWESTLCKKTIERKPTKYLHKYWNNVLDWVMLIQRKDQYKNLIVDYILESLYISIYPNFIDFNHWTQHWTWPWPVLKFCRAYTYTIYIL